MPEDHDDQKLLGAVIAGATVLFAGTASLVVFLQTILPIFGLQPGMVSDVAIGTLAGSAVTIITTVIVRLAARRNGKVE